jgi:putative oxidoreductase
MRTLAAQQGLALALLRAVIGVMLGYAGQQALFRGDLGVGELQALGVPLAGPLGPVLSAFALVGGLGLFVGLFTRVLALLFALEYVLLAGFNVNLQGVAAARLDLLLLAAMLVLATHGAGAYALDRPGQRWEP